MLSPEHLQAGLVLPLDKPRQWTSFQAVNKVKSVVRNLYGLKKFKIGHAGTLDPLATGLLLVCLGKATKNIPRLQDGDKVYTGTLVLGATTPCFDLERPVDRFFPYDHITLSMLQEKAAEFTGTILQVPPLFSAVKIDGQRAYEYARTDDPTVTILPKPVLVHSFEITAFRPGENHNDLNSQNTLTIQDSPSLQKNQKNLYQHPLGVVPQQLPQADFRIQCGKGTYIRSLARDLGEAIGSGAFLSALRREQVGAYSVDNALPPDGVQDYLMKL